MNVGQIFETHLGWAARGLGQQITAALEEWREANPDPEGGQAADRGGRQAEGQSTASSTTPTSTSRSTEEIVELAENLKNGVPMGTPVFDGAREADVSGDAREGRARPPRARSRSTTGAPATRSTAR